MMSRTIEYKTNKNKVNLWILSDFHFGARACAVDALKKRIEIIRKDKDAVVVINGDICDFIRFTDRRYDNDEIDPNYNDMDLQYEGIKEILKPIKNKIIAIGMGNHDYSVKKYYGFDVIRMLAEAFDCEYFHDIMLLTMNVKKHSHKVLITHGAAGGTTLAGAFNWLKKVAEGMEVSPDICAMGHVHRLDVVFNPKWDEEFNTKIKYLALTGNYYDTYSQPTSNYGTRKVFQPLPIGCVMFELFKDGKIQDHKMVDNQ